MTTHLLDEFPPVTTEAWEEAIARDLKGADYAKKLIVQTPEGMALRPYYRAEDTADLAFAATAPGQFPFARGTRSKGGWRIREQADAVDVKTANETAVKAIAAGAEEISFDASLVSNAADLEHLLAGLSEIPIHFRNATAPLMNLLGAQAAESSVAAGFSAEFDPFTDLDLAADLAKMAPASLSLFSVDAVAHEEAGANAVEEIAFALAAGIDMLAALEERGVKAAESAPRIEFTFAIGGNYFFSIAKLRAFRLVWAQAVESFGAPPSAARACIHARTSRWNKTVYDPHVNVLRATTEAMSAILGGADSITVEPFDACYKQSDEASRRLARNTQILLKEEALLGRVGDPGGGAYALEVITDFLASEAWKHMQQIESAGGWRKAVASGAIAEALAKSLAVREKEVVTRKRVLTGTNQYANPRERALDRIDAARFAEGKRGAQVYEQLRIRTERHAARTAFTPRFLLAEFGDPKMRSARSNFALNFFACAGFDLSIERFTSAEQIASRSADAIVLCSADAEYAPMVSTLIAFLKGAGRTTPVIIAGNPENTADLKAAGVDDFIHVRSNPIEVLGAWQRRLGIED